jgi:hypothetical protein
MFGNFLGVIHRKWKKISSIKSFRKTYWDWLTSVIIPVTGIALIVLEIDSNRKASLEQIKTGQQELQDIIAAEQTLNRQEALQAYINTMADLISNSALVESTPDSAPAIAATSLTSTLLNSMESQEKRAVIDFLYQSRLIYADGAIISLEGANLSGIDRAIAPKLGCHSASKPNFLGETC